jgi:signal peptidase II
MTAQLRIRSVAIIAAVVLLDRLTKIWIQNSVSLMDVNPVIPGFFNIVHTENPGAAFGFLSQSQGPWRSVLLMGVSAVVMSVILAMLWRPVKNGVAHSFLLHTGLALVFGGALGNAWDRLVRGTVTDFLQFFIGSYEFPSFNVADSAITLGATLLLLDLWKTRNHPAPQATN